MSRSIQPTHFPSVEKINFACGQQLKLLLSNYACKRKYMYVISIVDIFSLLTADKMIFAITKSKCFGCVRGV